MCAAGAYFQVNGRKTIVLIETIRVCVASIWILAQVRSSKWWTVSGSLPSKPPGFATTDGGASVAAISEFPAPYGSVSITNTPNTNTATITFTANVEGPTQCGGSPCQYSFGDGSTAALNTNGAVSILGGFAGITFTKLFAAGSPSFSSGGTGNDDGDGD